MEKSGPKVTEGKGKEPLCQRLTISPERMETNVNPSRNYLHSFLVTFGVSAHGIYYTPRPPMALDGRARFLD